MKNKSEIKILIVDDVQKNVQVLGTLLKNENYSLVIAQNGQEAIERAVKIKPDIILLDINMPDIDGISVTQRLRKNNIQIPICILSARDETTDRVIGLESGADDYLVKPFALQELLARLRALIRRSQVASTIEEQIFVGNLVIDPRKHACMQDKKELKLTRKEFELLYILAKNQDTVMSREQLLQTVWGYDFEVETNVVDVFIGYLRKKLEKNKNPRIIHTVHSVGFVLRI